MTKALPKLAKAASNPKLREAFETHLEETQGHVERLEQVFTAWTRTQVANIATASQASSKKANRSWKKTSMTAARIRDVGAVVTTVEADLATRAGVDQVWAAAAGRPIDALLANAGHGLGGAFLDQDCSQCHDDRPRTSWSLIAIAALSDFRWTAK